MRKSIALAITALMTCNTASAQGSVSCSGDVQYLGTGSDGSVYVNVGWGIWDICSVSVERADVTPDACKTWYSSLTTAKLSARKVVLFFNPAHPANQGASECSGLGHWVTRAPYHLELL